MSSATHIELKVQGTRHWKVAARSVFLEFFGGGAITINLVAVLSLDLHPRSDVSYWWEALHLRTFHRHCRVFCFKLRAKDMGP